MATMATMTLWYYITNKNSSFYSLHSFRKMIINLKSGYFFLQGLPQGPHLLVAFSAICRNLCTCHYIRLIAVTSVGNQLAAVTWIPSSSRTHSYWHRARGFGYQCRHVCQELLIYNAHTIGSKKSRQRNTSIDHDGKFFSLWQAPHLLCEPHFVARIWPARGSRDTQSGRVTGHRKFEAVKTRPFPTTRCQINKPAGCQYLPLNNFTAQLVWRSVDFSVLWAANLSISLVDSCLNRFFGGCKPKLSTSTNSTSCTTIFSSDAGANSWA